jgi:hypothetical protein
MHYQHQWYQMSQTIATHLPSLRRAQQHGLALWLLGLTLAKSSAQSAVLSALRVALAGQLGGDALRERLREWHRDGADKAAPCATQVDVRACFPHLLHWVLSWYDSPQVALAIDATTRGQHVTVLSISLLYHSCAIPLAWCALPGNQQRAWIPEITRLLALLAPAMPAQLHVLVLTDRGLWSPRLWQAIRRHNWHPGMRVQGNVLFAPAGQKRQHASALVPGPGHAWVGKGVAFKDKGTRRRGTLVVAWAAGHAEPWIVLTDLAPQAVGVSWYGMRMWVELGFRVLKSMGWQWHKTQRYAPARVERHWLILAVATLWVLAYGTRAELAEALGKPPGEVRSEPPPEVVAARAAQPRAVSVFSLGLSLLNQVVSRSRLWVRLWLSPESWPLPFNAMLVTYHSSP